MVYSEKLTLAHSVQSHNLEHDQMHTATLINFDRFSKNLLFDFEIEAKERNLEIAPLSLPSYLVQNVKDKDKDKDKD